MVQCLALEKAISGHCKLLTVVNALLDQLGVAHERQEDVESGEDSLRVVDLLVEQAGSLTSFKVSRQILKNDLNHVSSVSLLMTFSTALAIANKLTRQPFLTQAVSLSLSETIKEPGCSQMKRPKLCLNLVKS